MSSLIKWEPFDDFNRFFGSSSRVPSLLSDMQAEWNLGVDLYEKDNTLVAELNMPGFTKDEIKVSVKDDHLRVSGMHNEEKEEHDEEKQYYVKQIRKGSFERTVPLPAPVDKSSVKADYTGGVLTVTMPKTKEEEDEAVEVSIGD